MSNGMIRLEDYQAELFVDRIVARINEFAHREVSDEEFEGLVSYFCECEITVDELLDDSFADNYSVNGQTYVERLEDDELQDGDYYEDEAYAHNCGTLVDDFDGNACGIQWEINGRRFCRC